MRPARSDKKPVSSETGFNAKPAYFPTSPLFTPTPVQKSHPVVALCVPNETNTAEHGIQ